MSSMKCLSHLPRQCILSMCDVSIGQALLQRYSAQEEVVIGTPFANRDQSEVQDLIGCFVK